MNSKNFFKSLYSLTEIPVSLYDKNNELLETYAKYDFHYNESERECILRLLKEDTEKKIAYEEYIPQIPVRLYIYRAPRMQIILGPIAYGKIDRQMWFRQTRKQDIQNYQQCKISTVNTVLSMIDSVSKNLEYPEYEAATIPEKKKAEKTEFDEQSENIAKEERRQYDVIEVNHIYSEEIPLRNLVTEGKVDEVREKFDMYFPKYPVVIKDVYKNEEYMAVAAISLAARHAIEGGVPSKQAYLMNDIYLQKIAESTSIERLHEIAKEAYIELTKKVEQEKKKSGVNWHVKVCKKIIINRRLKKIDLDDLAKEVGISKEYMLKLFRKEEGKSIQEYILEVKMQAAANMLRYSECKVSEISEYLAFKSLSYFSREFKRLYGMSPKEYRNKNENYEG